jgi:hypothetical protein
VTTYRLPEALGGGEVEIVTPAWAGNAITCEVALVDQPDVKVLLARSLLTEVEPPLPPEPDGPAYVVDRDENVWQRRRTGGWQRIVGGQRSWADLWREFGPLTRLVPDP